MSKRKIWLIIGSILAVAAMLTAAVIYGQYLKIESDNVYTLQISLEGDRVQTLEYDGTYIEAGVTATFWGTHKHTQKVDVPVTVQGELDPKTPGVYTLKYVAQYKGFVGTEYRQIRVTDSKAPVITLVADPDKYTLPNETYEEEGFSAMDLCDGDLTAKVHRVQTREKVVYSVSDSSGNTTTVERVIVYDDPVKPALKLFGSSLIVLQTGQAYEEPGFSAIDNCDGDLSKQVEIAGSVNTDKHGTYKLTYSVSDAYGNLSSSSRIICVRDPVNLSDQIPTELPEGKIIYLTFDDGPGKYTSELLDVLNKYSVKATFFVVNTGYIDTIKRIAREGHSIGIHSATHNFKKIYTSETAYFKDLYAMQKIIKDLTGHESFLMRFPGGSSNSVSRSYKKGIMTRLTQAVRENGFYYFDWNVDSKDASSAKTSNDVYKNVIEGVNKRDISVVLQHDIKGYSVKAVERIIVWGLSNGYTFLPLELNSPVCHHKIKN